MMDMVAHYEPGTFDFISLDMESVCADKRCWVTPEFFQQHGAALKEFAQRFKLGLYIGSTDQLTRKQNYEFKPARLLTGPKKMHTHVQVQLQVNTKYNIVCYTMK